MVARETKETERNWHLIDASGQYVGRIATKIARLLMGKQKVAFTPHIDAGDYVVVINTNGLKISGKKADQKIYFHFSGYPGGLSRIPYKDLFKKDSGQVLKNAVWGMLAKNKLRDKKIKRLKLFRDEKQPYKDKFQK
ncbi:50S ribosomal protein L13 [Patescibacteria group bacterium]|nr:50S ribosomal protein L13 [Patescibacteria group bacterium]MBU4000095.1 50S ribosomal protein L13 [Patescibacteria group bacterium]MBU4056696.1 50S ribosomal protein L13 [Patescibacteria group bacterium]MBU4368093.1 50S ribosomal protein L13 [Patescibacteria group bacterium]